MLRIEPVSAAGLADLLAAWVLAEGVVIGDSDAALAARLDDIIGDPSRHGLDDDTRAGIRDLLRGHGYKPSGRGKPASEFLAAAAARDDFPRINNVVDINNLVSLETGWPISVVDLDRAGSDELELRLGRPDEAFVFNAGGQEIQLGGLLCLAVPGGAAIGNPVKDSMATKLTPGTSRVLAVIYSSRQVTTPEALGAAAERFAGLLREHAGATSTRTGVVVA